MYGGFLCDAYTLDYNCCEKPTHKGLHCCDEQLYSSSMYAWCFYVRRLHNHSASDAHAHLLLTLGELILEMTDGQLRQLLVRQFPSVLGYLLVEACLQIEQSVGHRRTARMVQYREIHRTSVPVLQERYGGMLFRGSCAPGESINDQSTVQENIFVFFVHTLIIMHRSSKQHE